MKTRNLVVMGLASASMIAGWAFFEAQQPTIAKAADHTEAPGAKADPAADIGDFFAWHDSAAGTLTMILTYDGLRAPAANQGGSYDADVLYGFHIDNTGDNIPNTNIWVRFGENSRGEWGVQAENLPGEAAPVVGPVNTDLTGDGGAKIRTGLFDDPFFFDLQGFQDTLATGTLSFDSTRDGFKGTNISVIVIEVPLAAASAGAEDIQVWATTGRI